MTPPPDLTDAEKRCEVCGREKATPGVSYVLGLGLKSDTLCHRHETDFSDSLGLTVSCYRIGYQRLRGALEKMLDAHCTERDETARGCHCFYAVEHATARAAIKGEG